MYHITHYGKIRLMLPYRNNVACVLFKGDEFLLDQLTHWKNNWWKFPQGGIEPGETEEEALRRELFEELGIKNIKIIGKSKFTNKYDWPPELQVKKGSKWRGQDQRFFVVELLDDKKDVKPDLEEVGKIKWVKKEELFDYIDVMSTLSGNYKDVITQILSEFHI